MLGTTGAAGVLGAIWPLTSLANETVQASERGTAELATEVRDLRRELVAGIKDLQNEIAAARSFPELAGVREQQRTFLRAAGKYPDFIEVGVDVWQGVYDWHVRWQRPITIARDASGRYTMPVMTTIVILRPDMPPGYVGPPYDSK